ALPICDVGFAGGEPDDHRALVARPDELARMILVDRDERVVPLELVVRPPHGLDEVALVVLLDQVRDRLGIRLRGERVAGGGESGSQLTVVLDDPVEDDRERLGALCGQWVRVLLGDPAVGRPACVAKPGRRGRRRLARTLAEVLERADGARVPQAGALEQRDPGRVVAAVLEALEAVQEQRLALTRPDVSDDSAHPGCSFPTDARSAEMPYLCRAFAAPASRLTRSAMLPQRP